MRNNWLTGWSTVGNSTAHSCPEFLHMQTKKIWVSYISLSWWWAPDSVTPITLFLLDMRWVLLTMRAFWNILFIRICVGVIEKNKVYKDSYRRVGILRYIFENIQDDSVRWYPSVTKTSRQISAHFLQYSSLWMNRNAQCELYNSCLYFFKVLLHYILYLCQRVPLKNQLSALSFLQIQRWTF